MRTVSDLKKYLEAQKLSPEQLSEQVDISNMTIRRLLKKDGHAEIPSKYLPQLNTLAASGNADFAHILKDIETQGQRMTDFAKLKQDLGEKLKDKRIGAEFRANIELIARGAFSKENWKYSALCIGALLYLINPVDMIPDTLAPIGYLDDFAVLSLVAAYLPKKALKKQGSARKD